MNVFMFVKFVQSILDFCTSYFFIPLWSRIRGFVHQIWLIHSSRFPQDIENLYCSNTCYVIIFLSSHVVENSHLVASQTKNDRVASSVCVVFLSHVSTIIEKNIVLTECCKYDLNFSCFDTSDCGCLRVPWRFLPVSYYRSETWPRATFSSIRTAPQWCWSPIENSLYFCGSCHSCQLRKFFFAAHVYNISDCDWLIGILKIDRMTTVLLLNFSVIFRFFNKFSGSWWGVTPR